MHQTAILIADDDLSINKLLQESLEGEGWKTFCAINGDEAIKSFYENHPDLVILDIMMPGVSSIDSCRHITATSSVPVVMLSARTDLDVKVSCLNAGADDYITKPFQLRELVARLKSVIRRSDSHDGAPLHDTFVSDDLDIDFNAKRVRVRGQEVSLTRTEYSLLEELATNAGKALTFEELLNKVWGSHYSNERQYLYVYIGRLRTKIEPDPHNSEYVITLPGIGYRFQKMRDKQVI